MTTRRTLLLAVSYVLLLAVVAFGVPLAISLMVVISKLNAATVPGDIRMKMLVLHAPEKLGLKQEYIQEHQAGAGH